jgi:hypothetical protein
MGRLMRVVSRGWAPIGVNLRHPRIAFLASPRVRPHDVLHPIAVELARIDLVERAVRIVEWRVSLEKIIGMRPYADSPVSQANAPAAVVDGARASRISKTMMMPITIPTIAGRTRAS